MRQGTGMLLNSESVWEILSWMSILEVGEAVSRESEEKGKVTQ